MTTSVSSVGFSTNKYVSSSPGIPSSINKGYSFGIRPQFSYGIVKKNNRLISYGLMLEYGKSRQTENSGNEVIGKSYGLNASIYFQRFIPIVSRFYFIPYYNFTVGLKKQKYGDENGYNQISNNYTLGGEFHPFSLSFTIKPQFNIFLTLGEASLYYEREHQSIVGGNRENKNITYRIIFNADVTRSGGFGIQFFLK